jgi:hypothetical protein
MLPGGVYFEGTDDFGKKTEKQKHPTGKLRRGGNLARSDVQFGKSKWSISYIRQTISSISSYPLLSSSVSSRASFCIAASGSIGACLLPRFRLLLGFRFPFGDSDIGINFDFADEDSEAMPTSANAFRFDPGTIGDQGSWQSLASLFSPNPIAEGCGRGFRLRIIRAG